MHPDVKKLIELQEVDQNLLRIRWELDSIPLERARREKKLDRFRAAAATASQELTSVEVESRAIDLGISQSDEEIQKLQMRLNGVKNNAEYQATLFQIESVKKERGELEEQGLVLLEKLEGLRSAVQTAEAATAEEQEVFDQFLKEAEVLCASREPDIAKVSQERETMVVDVAGDLLARYTKLLGARDGSAVCRAEGSICTGCYSSMTPNDHARLLGGNSIVECSSCQRILFVED